ncbi:MAG: NERD domain-containing protein [Anaerolineae bacterium]|nr:NERD domain-containing protein [Anaerolineae bacterium]
MRVVTDEQLIAQRAKLGKRASLIGLLILLVGFVVSFSPQLFLVSLGCLVIGFTVSNIGVYNANQWVREPRADQVLTRGMKGFSNKFTLFNYTGPVPHVVVGPPGVIVFLVKSQDGRIIVNGGRWKHPFTLRRLFGFFGTESLGNPSRDLKALIEATQKFVARVLPDAEVPVHGAVVFSSPKAELTIQNPDVPVLTEKQLKDFLRSVSKEEVLSPEQRKALMEAFQGRYKGAESQA